MVTLRTNFERFSIRKSLPFLIPIPVRFLQRQYRSNSLRLLQYWGSVIINLYGNPERLLIINWHLWTISIVLWLDRCGWSRRPLRRRHPRLTFSRQVVLGKQSWCAHIEQPGVASRRQFVQSFGKIISSAARRVCCDLFHSITQLVVVEWDALQVFFFLGRWFLAFLC